MLAGRRGSGRWQAPRRLSQPRQTRAAAMAGQTPDRRGRADAHLWRQARLLRVRPRDPQSLNAGARRSPMPASCACPRVNETRALGLSSRGDGPPAPAAGLAAGESQDSHRVQLMTCSSNRAVLRAVRDGVLDRRVGRVLRLVGLGIRSLLDGASFVVELAHAVWPRDPGWGRHARHGRAFVVMLAVPTVLR